MEKFMKNNKTIRIANAGGYWGDDPYALRRQLNGSLKIDYVSIDFLAEITMSIMQKQFQKDSNAGYAKDFITQLEPLLKILKEKKIKLITNAGGVNPKSCASALLEAALRQGVELKIAIVEGDNITQKIPEIMQQEGNKNVFTNMETKESFENISDKVLCANAYFGALPVVRALETNADIVLCGRVTDTGITVAPLIYEFGWNLTDYNKIASGIVAGHIIECGAQATGGNFTDWQKVGSFKNMGFPIVEVEENGDFFVTKHPELDGLVSVQTIKEQLLYEMGDPCCYLTPDVIADFSSFKISQAQENRVFISGVKGYPPTDLLKVSMAYADGFKSSGAIIVSGPNALQKSEVFAETFWERFKEECLNANLSYPSSTKHEFIGANSTHGNLTQKFSHHTFVPTEIYLKFSVLSPSKETLSVFRKLLPSLILSGPSGVAVTGGAPSINDVVSYWPALIPQEFTSFFVSYIESKNSQQWVDHCINSPWPITFGAPKVSQMQVAKPPKSSQSQALKNSAKPEFSGQQVKKVPLMKLAHARSGDKGDTANIGLIARSPECYEFLKKAVTAQQVQEWFSELCFGQVVRYEVPNLQALNFLLEESLGGGGTTSLQIDPQGKTYSQALLRCEVVVDLSVLNSIPEKFLPVLGEI
jgi:Acyclic terpene utilisation family protein AtuA